MNERLTPQREAEYQRWVDGPLAELIANGYTAVAPLLAELAAVRAERDQAREKALQEAAGHFDRMADREPDPHGYRARVMRGAANDIRRFAVATAPTAGVS